MIWVGISITLIVIAIILLFVPYRNDKRAKIIDIIVILCCVGAFLCTYLYPDSSSSESKLNVYIDGAQSISLDASQCQELNYYEADGYIRYKKADDDNLYYYYIPNNAVVKKE